MGAGNGRRRWGAVVALVCVLGIAGCKKDVLHGLDEIEANRVIVVLAKHGITADKEPDTAGDEGPRYKIVTDEKDAVRASEILLELGLPREKKKGLADVYASPSMIPTDMEEKARNLLALQGELASTLEAIDGVVDARVHLVLPELGLLGDRGPERGGQASVLVKHEVVKRPGGELSEREQLEKYRGMLISLQGDLREVRKALREELPAINKQQIGAINAIDVYLDKHRDDREARSALAALASLKQLTTRMRDRLAYLAALPKIKDLDETLKRIKEVELEALPFPSAAIRSLVAGAVAGLTADDVSVEFTRVVREPERVPVTAGYATGVDRNRFLLVAGAAGLMTLLFLGTLLWVRSLRRKLKAAQANRPRTNLQASVGGGA